MTEPQHIKLGDFGECTIRNIILSAFSLYSSQYLLPPMASYADIFDGVIKGKKF
jgi:hypothetical protein